jgi:hypothetical protein
MQFDIEILPSGPAETPSSRKVSVLWGDSVGHGVELVDQTR